jgi:hypothetical protein
MVRYDYYFCIFVRDRRESEGGEDCGCSRREVVVFVICTSCLVSLLLVRCFW